MSASLDPNSFGYNGDRPYRQLYPPEPVTKLHIVSTKDDTYIDETTGTVVRVPVEDRPPQKITRLTSFGVEYVDESTAADQEGTDR